MRTGPTYPKRRDTVRTRRAAPRRVPQHAPAAARPASDLDAQRSLRGSTLLITGANTGIGLALAHEAIALGADVHVTCRTSAKTERTVRALRGKGGSTSVHGWTVDFSDLASVTALAREIEDAGTSIDTAILNAGVHVPFGTTSTVDGLELHHQVNFLAPACLFRALAAQGSLTRGAVYVSSDAHHRGHIPALFPLSFWARYARSKLDATTFFQAARPLFPHLTISVLSPGNVESDVHRYKPSWVRAVRLLTSRGRPSDVAAREIIDATFFSADPEQYRNRGIRDSPAPRSSDPERMRARWIEVDAVFTRALRTRPEASSPACDIVRNHADTVVRLGPTIQEPASVTEVADIVRAVRDRGETLRVVGAKHSYNDCFYSHQTLISLARFDHIGELDEERGTVTVGAGVTVQSLCDHLDARGHTLRWAGNSGTQSFVGAALTGTHGYARDGGLLAELIVGLRVVTGTGEVMELAGEADLRALRVSLGTLAVVVRATVEVERKSRYVTYALETIDEDELVETLPRLGKEHAYLRFFPNRLKPSRMSVLTIDPAESVPDADSLARIRYIDQTDPPAHVVAVLRSALANRWVRACLARLPSPRIRMSVVAEFSSLMFVNAGITNRWHRLVGLVYQAWNNDRTRNVEIAIRPEDFATFLSAYRESTRAYPSHARDVYFTGRYVGGSRRTLLGANYERDVVFIDIHVTKSNGASDFLRDLEERVSKSIPTRPHWGKEFVSGRAALNRAYPPGVWDEFAAAKQRLDPDNVFSNAYTKRVFGW